MYLGNSSRLEALWSQSGARPLLAVPGLECEKLQTPGLLAYSATELR